MSSSLDVGFKKVVELEGEDSDGWRVEGSGAIEWKLVGLEVGGL